MGKTKGSEGSSQVEAFIRTAHKLGCDESEAAFDRTLKKLASAPPPKTVQERKRKPAEHASDCALHNAPAYEPGRCDCDAEN